MQATQVAPVKSYARAVTPLIPAAEAQMPPRLRCPFPANLMGVPSFTPDKRHICHECQRVGHIGKDRAVRRARLVNVADNRAQEALNQTQGN